MSEESRLSHGDIHFNFGVKRFTTNLFLSGELYKQANSSQVNRQAGLMHECCDSAIARVIPFCCSLLPAPKMSWTQMVLATGPHDTQPIFPNGFISTPLGMI